MNHATQSHPPFGTYRLAPWLEFLRRYANDLPDTFYGRRMASLIRHLCFRLAGDGPFDITLFEGQRMRVYPRSNRCEKRAFAGLGSWDRRERAYLEGRVTATDHDRPFVFVDGGANVGLYSLFVIDVAGKLGRPVQVLAIEPDPENRQRLTFNLQASQAATAQVAPYALGGSERVERLVFDDRNRGEAQLARAASGAASRASGAAGVDVEVRPLARLLADAGIERVDALKLDIEGVEHETLEAFFETADPALWPEVILLEVGRDGRSPALELCRAHGYEALRAGRINWILRRTRAA